MGLSGRLAAVFVVVCKRPHPQGTWQYGAVNMWIFYRPNIFIEYPKFSNKSTGRGSKEMTINRGFLKNENRTILG